MTTTTTDAVKGAEGWELKQLLTLYWCSEHGVTWDVFPSTWTIWLREHQQKTFVMHCGLQIILQIFNKYLQNLKRACIFHLINGQNLLGVTKVICQQSLTCTQWCPLKKTFTCYLYYHGGSINKLNCFSPLTKKLVRFYRELAVS